MFLPKIIFRNSVLLVLMISMLLACCGIPQMIQEIITNPVNDEKSSLRHEEESIPEQIDLSQRFPAQAVQAAAKELYDSLEVDNGDPSDVIRRIVIALDIYQSPDTDKDSVLARIEDGIPVLLEDHILAMASAYQTGILVSLDSFIESLQEWGMETKAPAGPLSIEYFTNRFAELPAQDEYTLGELWPALILHLGLERANREESQDDPIWGDGMLDPLQFTLFSFTVFLAASVEDDVSQWDIRNPLRQVGGISAFLPAYLLTGAVEIDLLASMPMIEPGIDVPTTDWEPWLTNKMTKRIIDPLVDAIGEIVGLPFNKMSATKAVICASVILFSYDLTLRTNHYSVRRRWPENPPGSEPFEAELTAHLTFDFIPYNDFSRAIVEEACGFPIPQDGPISGKPLKWSIDGELPLHGNLTVGDKESGAGGDAHATYTTFDEKVPRLLRTGLAPVAGGRVWVQVSQLLPAQWRTLDIFVKQFREGAVYMQVNYYEFPEMQLILEITVAFLGDFGPVIWADFGSMVDLDLNEAGDYYRGSDELIYVRFNDWLDPNCDVFLSYDLTDGEIEVFLKVDSSDTDIQLFYHAKERPKEATNIINTCPPDSTRNWTIIYNPDGWMWHLLLEILQEDIGEHGIQARGPWEKSDDSNVIARNHYEANLPLIEVEVKLDLVRR